MTRLIIHLKGGSGSGHFGHSGRPGREGGSLPGKGSGSVERFSVTPQDYGRYHSDDVRAGEVGNDYIVLSKRGRAKLERAVEVSSGSWDSYRDSVKYSLDHSDRIDYPTLYRFLQNLRVEQGG